MTATGNAYLSNSMVLTLANIKGPCVGRTQPRYLGQPGTYGSVPYDWGGADTVSGFNGAIAWGLTNNAASTRMFYDRVAPGLTDQYDSPEMLPLVSPRPFIVIAGLQDPRNPMPGVQLTMAAAMAAYARDGAADRVKLFTADVGHDGGYAPFHMAAVNWLDQWLGKSAKP